MIHTLKINQKYVDCRTSPGFGGWVVGKNVRDERVEEKYSKLGNREGQVLTMALILGMTGEKYSISIWLE